MSWHPSEEALDDYVNDSLSAQDAEPIAAHIKRCEECSDFVAGARDLKDHLGNRETWRARTIISGLSSPRWLSDQLHQLRVSDEAAEFLLAPIITGKDRFEAAQITENPSYYTAGVIRKLVAAADDARETDAAFALALANAATVIAEVLAPPAYTREFIFALRGAAWRERGNALRYVGRYPDALEACDRADASFTASGNAEFDLARVAFVRSTVLWKMASYDSGLQFAREAAAIFRRYGDQQRVAEAALLEGSILCDSGNHTEALKVFLQVEPVVDKLDDLETSARLENNLAVAHQHLGQRVEAARHYQSAVAAYTYLGMTIELLRTNWSLGLLALEEGYREAGLSRLMTVASDFASRGMLIESALVDMDRARELVRAQSFTDVAAICVALAERFATAGMYVHAREALDYVREAAVMRRADDSVIAHARRYFESLEDDAERRFEPPSS